MSSRSRHVLVLLAFLTLGSTLFAAPQIDYKVVKKATLGGEGFWDYLTVDPAARRVYISRGTHVMVIDADSLKLVGDIPDTPGVHGIALAPEFGRGFISDGQANRVTIFDPKTLAKIGEASVGTAPDAIIYDPASKRVFTFNARSHDTTAVDAKSGQVAGTLALGGKPEFAQPDGTGNMFVNIEDTSELVKFDAKKLTVLNRWKLAPCEEPTGLAFDKDHERLFSVCGNKLMVVVDSASGKIMTTVPIGGGVDGVMFDPAQRLAFASCGQSGTLVIVREDSPTKFAKVGEVETAARARTLAFDPKTHDIYTVTAQVGAPETPGGRPRMVPGSFEILVISQGPSQGPK